jgi:hypothetical protein
MGDTIIKSLFSGGEKKTKEELEEEKKKKQEKLNPFLIVNRGFNAKKNDEFGYSVTPKQEDFNGYNGALRLVIDSFGESPEKHYYYFINLFQAHPTISSGFFGMKAKEIYKLKDQFDASVSSSFHGQIGTKISAIQGQVSNYLSQIGQLTKTLLPLVREVRMMDERMQYYKNSYVSKDNRGKKDADQKAQEKARQNEITLKSTWIEVVEQGMQNPNSVYSMSTKLGFVTLPDLFFATNPLGKDAKEQKKNLEKVLGAMEEQHALNKKVRDALTKKLTQYYTWKERTQIEMEHTWKFRLKSLKQHYNVINLYKSWLIPNLTTLKALQMKNDTTGFHIVSSFESSKLELELLIDLKEKKGWHACVLVRMLYFTRPDLHYTSSGQKQPIHAGRIEISIEPYVASKDDIEWYRKHCEKESLKLVSGTDVDIGKDIESILNSLGEDVEKYLKEAEGKEEKKKKDKKPDKNLSDPFKEVANFFKQFKPGKDGAPSRKDMEAKAAAKKKQAGFAALMAWVAYDVFKKGNGMYTPLP